MGVGARAHPAAILVLGMRLSFQSDIRSSSPGAALEPILLFDTLGKILVKLVVHSIDRVLSSANDGLHYAFMSDKG